MKMHTVLTTFAAILIPALSFAQQPSVLPPAANTVIKAYERDVAAAKDRAVKQLQLIQTAETQRGKLEAALAVKNAITGLGSASGAEPAPQLTPLKTGKIAIKANAKFGTELGSVTAGTTLKLEYVEGKWAMSGGVNEDPTKLLSPDDPTVYASNHLGIFAVENGEAKKLADVPPETKKRTFRYRFDKAYPVVILRIIDSDAADNPGYVIYDVTASK